MTQVKICGITNLEDACAAVEAGADLLGFVFYPPSPRYVAPEVVRDIAARLPRAGVTLVGVFVNESLGGVLRILDRAGLDLAQLSGDEPVELAAALTGRAYKGLRPRTAAELRAQAAAYGAGPGDARAPDLLVDAYHPRHYGGTGQTTDWATAAALARERRLLLAGGLTPENVAEAVRTVRPWGVDVSSGVEARPGRKDHAAVRQFIATVKGVKL